MKDKIYVRQMFVGITTNWCDQSGVIDIDVLTGHLGVVWRLEVWKDAKMTSTIVKC